MNNNKIKACYLGNYLPWDVKKQVKIIKEELEWQGDLVEGILEQYDYEKIECYMQGVRDYIKYIKRGYTRPTHLASIDIRNNRDLVTMKIFGFSNFKIFLILAFTSFFIGWLIPLISNHPFKLWTLIFGVTSLILSVLKPLLAK